MIDKEKLVSVIIPVYNVESRLNHCIDSILQQAYSNLEIILVNDGSTDRSGIICDEYTQKDMRVKVIHETNSGPGTARNTGLDYATGEFISFVDSDDYIANTYIMEMVRALESYQADIIQCMVIAGNDDSYVFDGNMDIEIDEYSNLEYLRNMYHIKDFEGSPTKVYRRKVFEQLRFPDKRYCDDVALTYRLVYKADKVLYYHKIIYYYFQTSNSIMRGAYYINKADKILSFEERLCFFREIGEVKLYERALIQYIAVLLKEYYLLKKNFPHEKITREVKTKIKETSKLIYTAKSLLIFIRWCSIIAARVPFFSGLICNRLI